MKSKSALVVAFCIAFTIALVALASLPSYAFSQPTVAGAPGNSNVFGTGWGNTTQATGSFSVVSGQLYILTWGASCTTSDYFNSLTLTDTDGNTMTSLGNFTYDHGSSISMSTGGFMFTAKTTDATDALHLNAHAAATCGGGFFLYSILGNAGYTVSVNHTGSTTAGVITGNTNGTAAGAIMAQFANYFGNSGGVCTAGPAYTVSNAYCGSFEAAIGEYTNTTAPTNNIANFTASGGGGLAYAGSVIVVSFCLPATSFTTVYTTTVIKTTFTDLGVDYTNLWIVFLIFVVLAVTTFYVIRDVKRATSGAKE